MNLFSRTPTTKKQRERWITLISLVENNQITSVDEARELLSKRGFTVSEVTAIKDLKACNVSKIDGVYTIIPYTMQSVVEEIILARMRAALMSMYWQGDMVILNVNRGAGPWLASALREFEDDQMVSFMDTDDAIWIMATEGNGEAVYNRLHSMFMKARQ